MRTRDALLICLTVAAAILTGACTAHARDVSSRGLIEQGEGLDKTEITYRGEAISCILTKGEYSWINAHDGYNAIGIYCPGDLLKGLSFLGDYKHRGDRLEVKGVFNFSCEEHGGDLDIHAEEIRIIKKGGLIKRQPDKKRLIFSLILFGVAVLAVTKFKGRG
ncbi:DNA-binding protein [Candidatus Omnitrophota bacterium]